MNSARLPRIALVSLIVTAGIACGFLFGGGPHGAVGSVCLLLFWPGVQAAGALVHAVAAVGHGSGAATGGVLFTVVAFLVEWCAVALVILGFSVLRRALGGGNK